MNLLARALFLRYKKSRSVPACLVTARHGPIRFSRENFSVRGVHFEKFATFSENRGIVSAFLVRSEASGQSGCSAKGIRSFVSLIQPILRRST